MPAARAPTSKARRVAAGLRRWWRARPGTPRGRPMPLGVDAGIVAAIGGLHVADHTLLPEHHHLGIHVATAAGAIGVAGAAGLGARELGVHPDHLGRGLRRGLASASAITAGLALAAWHPRTRSLFVDDRAVDVTTRHVALTSLVRIPLGTAVYEEVVFRGLLLALARRRFGTVGGVAVTAGLFGLWHVLPAIADQEANPATRDQPVGLHVAGTVVATSIAGVLFSLERLRTGSVVAPILSHWATNAVTYALAARVAAGRTDPGPRPTQFTERTFNAATTGH